MCCLGVRAGEHGSFHPGGPRGFHPDRPTPPRLMFKAQKNVVGGSPAYPIITDRPREEGTVGSRQKPDL